MANVYFLSPNPNKVICVDDVLFGVENPAKELPDTDPDYLTWASTKTAVPYNTAALLGADYGALSGQYSWWKPQPAPTNVEIIERVLGLSLAEIQAALGI